MKRIILHWTGGIYAPNDKEKKCYHYLIGYHQNKTTDNKGNIKFIDVATLTQGNFTPEDNLNCNDGRYAAHTGGGNTGSIGVSLCGMLGFISASNQGKFPLKRVQFERAYKLCAELCKKYAIVISPATVLTHYEFGKANPATQSRNKPDISFIPYEPNLKPDEVGNFIRNKVQWYFDKV
ncbi:MAG: peptidoglycan recognition family protein [Candidatus Gastranaerophilales bacterium]|nr:peptidoglycan recognition family protein [Candidatus Gastranaerophilales bacterium]